MGVVVESRGVQTPPVVIVRCPAGDGHFWAELNPLWTATGGRKIPLRMDRWCPEHQHEKNQHRATALRASRKRATQAYDKLPLPKTKKCNKCNKVKPSWAFYTRLSRRRVDGTRALQLYAYCKVCTRKMNVVAYAALSPDERLRRHRDYNSPEKAKARMEKYIKEHSSGVSPTLSPFVDPAPFVEWFKNLNGERPTNSQMGMALTRRVRAVCSGEEKRIRLANVEKVGVIVGYTHLSATLYPDA